MTTSRHFNIIVPRIDRTGPSNVAIDIGHAAVAAGYEVRVLGLSGAVERNDLEGFEEVRRWRLSDLWRLRGVVHTHGLRPDLIGALTALAGGRTLITTLHNYFLVDLGFEHRRWVVGAAWWAWRWAIGRFDHRVCISQSMRQYYRRMLPAMSFDVCYNFRAAPEEALSAAPTASTRWLAQQRDAKRIVMAYVGMLGTRKNVLRLLEAVAPHDDLAVVMCGDGPLRETLLAFVEERGMRDRVLMAGHVARPDVVLADCDMLVLPSLAEGLPLVVLEAIRLGKPCLLSNIAVHRELAQLSIGATFDRHRFSDFASKARELAHGASPKRARGLQALWEQRFSPRAGFDRYHRLLASSD